MDEMLDNEKILDALFTEGSKFEDLKEPEQIVPSVGDKPIDEKTLEKEGEELVSSHNSESVLPGELGNTDATPISNKNTPGIHDGDGIDGDKPVSSHNSKKFL